MSWVFRLAHSCRRSGNVSFQSLRLRPVLAALRYYHGRQLAVRRPEQAEARIAWRNLLTVRCCHRETMCCMLSTQGNRFQFLNNLSLLVERRKRHLQGLENALADVRLRTSLSLSNQSWPEIC